MKSEANVLKQIMLAASKLGQTVWRNNVGKAWMGKKLNFVQLTAIDSNGGSHVFAPGEVVVLLAPRFVEFGLTVGASDLIGIEEMIITEADVGRTVGVFVAMEVKSKTGRASKEQQKFIGHIAHHGGLAAIVRSPADIPTNINREDRQ